jgi:hypothetical protein
MVSDPVVRKTGRWLGCLDEGVVHDSDFGRADVCAVAGGVLADV